MELFLQLALTIAISLLFSFIIAKLLSATPDSFSRTIKKDRDLGVERKIEESETEARVESLEKSEGRMMVQVPELVMEDDGSARTSGEIGVGGLREEIPEECCDYAHNVLDESPERVGVSETEIGLGIEGDGVLDDDWEGIETTDLETKFGAAMVFACSEGNADQFFKLGTDVQMQLYGLLKIAIEGQCMDAQPIALKVSARAKWNAWKQLGNMSPDVAMEQYISLLSKSIPNWEEQDGGHIVSQNCTDTTRKDADGA